MLPLSLDQILMVDSVMYLTLTGLQNTENDHYSSRAAIHQRSIKVALNNRPITVASIQINYITKQSDIDSSRSPNLEKCYYSVFYLF